MVFSFIFLKKSIDKLGFIRSTLNVTGERERDGSQRSTKGEQMGKRFKKVSNRERVSKFHEEFAEKIIGMIEKGVAPWQKPWAPGQQTSDFPTNAVSKRSYSGTNVLALFATAWDKGYFENRWATFKQIKDMGGFVRAGEKGTQILSVGIAKAKPEKDDEGNPVLDENGEQVFKAARRWLKVHTVFNVSQADGIEVKKVPVKVTKSFDKNEKAEKVIESSPVPIFHVSQNRAYYRPSEDTITIPEREQFDSASAYYQVAIHEIAHATGHESRLNRTFGVFGDETYAREELRAEIASMMVGHHLEVGFKPQHGASYVKNWIQALKDDPEEIRKAASDAQKISDYIVALAA